MLPLVLVLALLRHDVLHQLVAVLLVWQVPVSCQRLPPPAALGWRLGDALDAPLEAQPQLANLGAPHRPLSQSEACDVRFLGIVQTLGTEQALATECTYDNRNPGRRSLREEAQP